MRKILPWSMAGRKKELENRIFSVETRTMISPTSGREHDFFVLEAGDWVNVIPVTPDGQVVLVRQFRHGTGEMTLEIPGGLIEDGQTPEQAAARELLEETGFAGRSLKLLARVRPNPAILTNWCYMFLACGVEKTAGTHWDETEEIEVVLADLAAIPEMVKRGEIDHSLVLSAFLFFYLNNGEKLVELRDS